jgi:hypothetical protein
LSSSDVTTVKTPERGTTMYWDRGHRFDPQDLPVEGMNEFIYEDAERTVHTIAKEYDRGLWSLRKHAQGWSWYLWRCMGGKMLLGMEKEERCVQAYLEKMRQKD